jgi:hypothetical protein
LEARGAEPFEQLGRLLAARRRSPAANDKPKALFVNHDDPQARVEDVPVKPINRKTNKPMLFLEGFWRIYPQSTAATAFQ